MLKPIFLLFFLILLNTSECSPQKQDERISSLETEVKQLKAEVVGLKEKRDATPVHHYELRNEGLRTWRFDSATGETCIQLTSEADWKRKETKSQSCTCEDSSAHYFAMPMDTDHQIKLAEGYYARFVQSSCGG
jgi:hypothetical protein